MNDLERRFYISEIRIDPEAGEKPAMVGYAAVFNSPSRDLGGFVEVIEPGAFENSPNTDVRALYNHDPNMVLGRTTSGTLEIKEDPIGLHVRIEPPNTQYAADLMELIARGDISQMSFAFRTIADQWRQEEGQTIRTLISVDLYDVSPVTFPAYEQTFVDMRSAMNIPCIPADIRGATMPADQERARARLNYRRRLLDILR